MNKLGSILSKYPHYYAKSDSNLYGFTKAFSDELELVLDQIERLDDMVGIDTTRDEDLEFRWGRLLNIKKLISETYSQYRTRLKTSVTMLSGGTSFAIKYAIAVALGVNNDPTRMDQMITIHDAWEYDGDVDIPPESRVPCNIVCDIDMMGQYYSPEDYDIIVTAIRESKAAGIQFHLAFRNFLITFYINLSDLTYNGLTPLEYDKLGKEV